jgi:transposase-like protein
MATPVLSAPYFHNEEAAYALIEAHIWANGRVCPHCGVVDESGALKDVRSKVSKKSPEGKLIHGLYKCYACRQQFTVKVGTIFEDSRLPLRLWLQAIHLLCSSKKGFTTRQLQRILGCGMKTAWHLGHRIREAMRDGSFAPMGGEGKVVEADETYMPKPKRQHATKRTSGAPYTGGKSGRGTANKHVVVSLVERGGKVRSFHVERADKATVAAIVTQNIKRESHLHTDESRLYTGADAHVAEHHTVEHRAGEYARDGVHSNTVEGYFGIFKRGMRGVYQHCSEKHLHRYLAEFDFRYNNRSALGVEDEGRTLSAINGAKGKHLPYRAAGRSAA